jgi:hypothetical protein
MNKTNFFFEGVVLHKNIKWRDGDPKKVENHRLSL